MDSTKTHNIKKGDTVRCVEPGHYAGGSLTKGKVYTCLGLCEQNLNRLIRVKGDQDREQLIYAARFRKDKLTNEERIAIRRAHVQT